MKVAAVRQTIFKKKPAVVSCVKKKNPLIVSAIKQAIGLEPKDAGVSSVVKKEPKVGTKEPKVPSAVVNVPKLTIPELLTVVKIEPQVMRPLPQTTKSNPTVRVKKVRIKQENQDEVRGQIEEALIVRAEEFRSCDLVKVVIATLNPLNWLWQLSNTFLLFGKLVR